MMDDFKTQIDEVKTRSNIVDVIDQHIKLTKKGKDYWACCPFHGEKTPSFTVSEDKQIYHCFGCGANGDVINFVQEYAGIEFVDAVKKLGGELEFQPTEEALRNIKRNRSNAKIGNLPPCHKQDIDGMRMLLEQYRIKQTNPKLIMNEADEPMYLVENCFDEVINGVFFSELGSIQYYAGGRSYNGFTKLKSNDENKWLACVDLQTAFKLKEKTKLNVLVCWNEYSLEYVCKSHCGEMKVMPVLTSNDSDDITHCMDYFTFDGEKIKLNNKEL